MDRKGSTMTRDQIASKNDGYIYLIEDPDELTVKIGRAKDPYARLASLQTGRISEITLIATFRADMSGESILHDRFADRRIRREWFNDDDGRISDLIYDDREFRAKLGLSFDMPLMRNEISFIAETAGKSWVDDFGLSMQRKHLGSVVIVDPAS